MILTGLHNTEQRNFLDCAISSAQKMPEKTSIYSTLVGLLNAKSYSFGGELVETLVRALKEALRAAEWDTARNCVRFLADLVNCKVVDIASLVTLLENFISVTAEENTPQVSDLIYASIGYTQYIREIYYVVYIGCV